jgi:squalene-hopene/tetraprenyl-beta-curcumene cyclase
LTDDDLSERVRAGTAKGIEYLYRRQRADGAWTDRLSSSAVPTSMALVVLSRADRDRYRREIEEGLGWLRDSQRGDGGWSQSDTDPPSDTAATGFAVAALRSLDADASSQNLSRAQEYLDANGGEDAILGDVRTWRELVALLWVLVGLRDISQVPRQPIEAMLLPAQIRNRASIALPGVVALGAWQTRALDWGRVRLAARRRAERKGLAWLRALQGPNGGIEECQLMAGFVFMGLEMAGPGVGDDIQRGCVSYLLSTRRSDGSWATDRDLEIAVTAYAILALGEFCDVASEPRLAPTRDWLLSTQWRTPYEPLGQPAGGWSWAVPSGWPESEDTAVVLTVLSDLGLTRGDPSVQLGVGWLLTQQNRNGSWSEWIRGGSQLFDGPCPGVTAHVVMALRRPQILAEGRRTLARALRFFKAAQAADGSFSSLWFRDSVHGTAKVLEAYADLGLSADPVAERARQWLLATQRDDGAWPGTVLEGPPEGGTVEETSWALFSLLKAGHPAWDRQVIKAVQWLADRRDEAGTWRPSAVGLYYPTMFYGDDLIAHTYALRALGRWLTAASEQAGKSEVTEASR